MLNQCYISFFIFIYIINSLYISEIYNTNTQRVDMAESILTKSFDFWECLIKIFLGFPSSPVVKNPPANAGDMGSIPGPGKFHIWSD